MKWLMAVALMVLLLGFSQGPTPSAYPSQPEWFPAHQNHYPSIYIGPARTGLPSKGYFYPNRYVPTNGWFTGYRKYTHRAYSDMRTIWATPYAVTGY